MYFRAQRKLQGEVSLSEAIETDKAGNALYLQDVVGADDTMQVAAAYGISRSYVSRIEKRALEKLEAALREHCYP